MNIQKKLYASVEHKLVLWCIAAMVVMSTSFIVPVYLVVRRWLDDHAAADMRGDHHGLILTLAIVQLVVIGIGSVLSVVFARRALRPIRRAHQAQADFAANAHHQLRTPITVMQAEIDTALVREGQTPEDYRQVLKSIGQELHLLRATSENLLSLADNAVSGKPSGRPSTAEDLTEVIASLQRRYRIRINVSAGRLPLPLSREELIVIFEILLDNTVKHGGIIHDDITVNVALKSGKGGSVLEYSDNGKGIAKGEEKQLFERTFRGSRAVKSRVQGSGLGLAIVAEIVRAHGGGVKASSVSAKGGFRLVVRFPKNIKR